jgi:hypothetical protein
LATAKTQAVAAALPSAQKEPERLQAALLDAQVFLKSTAGWAWEGLRSALTSEGARTIVSGITEAAAKGAIQGCWARRVDSDLEGDAATGWATSVRKPKSRLACYGSRGNQHL